MAVLPAEPVIPTTVAPASRVRAQRPRSARAARTSGTTIHAAVDLGGRHALDQRGHRTGRERVDHELVTVAHAPERHEAGARPRACASRTRTTYATRSAAPPWRAPPVTAAISESVTSMPAPPAPRATTTRSSNGTVVVPVVCPDSWPLPGDEHDVARHRLGEREPDRGAAVELDRPRAAPPAESPSVTVAEIAAGSSERGLSDVTTTTSAAVPATRPISARLPRSRSPPHPNDHDDPAVARELARPRPGGARARRACGRSRRRP